MKNYEIKNVEIGLLKPHERIIDCHLAKLTAQIEKDGFISEPVIVDRNTIVILDGHHRFNVLKNLGLKFCPVCLVDYLNDEMVTVDCWRKGERITKSEVLSAGLTGKLLDPKTSRHSISEHPKDLDILLSELG